MTWIGWAYHSAKARRHVPSRLVVVMQMKTTTRSLDLDFKVIALALRKRLIGGGGMRA